MTLSEVREMIMNGQHGYCMQHDCLEKATELHHRIPNTAVTRKLYPKFLNSPFNLVGLDKECHVNKKHEFEISNDLAMAYEAWLADFAMIWYNKGKEELNDNKNISLQKLRKESQV